MTLPLGVITPVLTKLPRSHAPWEDTAGIEEVARVAETADRLGYHHLTCSEHVAVPTAVADRHGSRYWDPLATFGYLAARTTRIRLATHVVVLGYHHPLAIAKRYGTLDRISGGRVVLGVGVGSSAEEFALLGASFEDRGARADDAIRALRAVFGHERPEYHGDHFDIEHWEVDPCGSQQPPPIWVGGYTKRSLRRAVELGDAWVPFGLSPEQLVDALAAARTTDAWARRTRPLDVIPWTDPPLDPLGDPVGARRALESHPALGATMLNIRLVHRSLAHYQEQLEATMALAVDVT
ncbi:MAG: TIGR03619 family F420-dependent LLM class oxidoreductase [Acidimicrobiales bacterium]|jgi:probable F420-dependent oxidoreductase|nr:TIGR03619 family F420-dependent LLM class oxidoreductase [Acidimicrobiales bacterium]